MSVKNDDVLFLNSTIIDGSGSTPRYNASLMVREGRIHSIRSLSEAYTSGELEGIKTAGTRIVDCEDGRFCLCPGFIDMHAHSDLSLLHTPVSTATCSLISET